MWTGKTLGGLADDDGFHAGADRAAAVLFGDAVRFQHADLPFGRAAAVAAHGGNDKRLRAELLQMIDDCLNDDRDVGDTTAAAGDGDRVAGSDLLLELEACELARDLARHVVDTGPLERLANAEKLGVDASSHGLAQPL